MPNELKPCPFCGGKVELKMNCYCQCRVVCTRCECSCWVGDSRNEKSVVKAWNRRADNA